MLTAAKPVYPLLYAPYYIYYTTIYTREHTHRCIRKHPQKYTHMRTTIHVLYALGRARLII